MKHVLMAGLCLFFTVVQCAVGSTTSAQVKKPSSRLQAKTSASHKPEITIQSGHAGIITTLAFSPDGRFLLSGGSDSTLKIWDTTNWRLVRMLPGPIRGVNVAEWSPDGQKILSVQYKTLKLFDVTTGQILQTFQGQSGQISCIAYSPDGQFVLSGSQDTTLKLWEVKTGREIRSFPGHSEPLKSVAFHPDGRFILSESGDGAIRLWNIKTGDVTHVFSDGISRTQYNNSPTQASARFTPDGKTIVSGGSDKLVRLWDTSTGQLLRSFVGPTDEIFSILCSSDGKYVFSLSRDHKIKIWEITTGREFKSIYPERNFIGPMALSPDGKKLATGISDHGFNILDLTSEAVTHMVQIPQTRIEFVQLSPDAQKMVSCGSDGTLKMWDIQSNHVLWEIPGKPDTYFPKSFSPDSTTLALFGSNGVIQRVETQTGRVVQSAATGIDQVFGGAISPSGRYLATINQDQVTIWDTTTGQPPSFTSDFCSPPFLSFSPDESSVLTQFDEYTFKLWSVPDGRELRSFGGLTRPISTARFNSNGKYILSQDRDQGLTVWETASGRLVQALAGNERELFDLSTDISADGKRVASLCAHGVLHVWDVSSGRKIRTYLQSVTSINSVKLSPDGRYLFSAGGNTVTVWNLAEKSNGELLDHSITFAKESFSPSKLQLMFSPDGRYAAFGNKCGVRLWEISTGRLIRFFPGSSRWKAYTISPDGKYICSGGEDGQVQLWEIETGKLIFTCEGHTKPISSVAISPDGKYLISGSKDRTLRIWKATTGEEIGILTGHTKGIVSVALSPDGKYIASNSDDNTLRLWEVATFREVWTAQEGVSNNQFLLFSPDGTFITDRFFSTQKWETRTGKKSAFLNQSVCSQRTLLCFTPDGKYRFTTESDHLLRLTEIDSDQVIQTFSGQWQQVYDQALSPDGRFILLGSPDGLRLLSTTTGQELYKMVAFTDGEWLTITPQNYYVASPQGERYLNVRVGNQVMGIDSFRNKFNQPEKVKQIFSQFPAQQRK